MPNWWDVSQIVVGFVEEVSGFRHADAIIAAFLQHSPEPRLLPIGRSAEAQDDLATIECNDRVIYLLGF